MKLGTVRSTKYYNLQVTRFTYFPNKHVSRHADNLGPAFAFSLGAVRMIYSYHVPVSSLAKGAAKGASVRAGEIALYGYPITPRAPFPTE